MCTYKSKLSSYISHSYHTSKEDARQPGSYVQEVRRRIPACIYTHRENNAGMHLPKVHFLTDKLCFVFFKCNYWIWKKETHWNTPLYTSSCVVRVARNAMATPRPKPLRDLSNVHHNPTESAARVRDSCTLFAKSTFWQPGGRSSYKDAYQRFHPQHAERW